MKLFDRQQFKNPPEEYSAAPFWFLNGDLDDNELKRQLSEMKGKGVDKVILHSRKGCEVEYLSEKWFEKIGVILNECEKLGLTVLIYDEDNWPSGYAGGKVTGENPAYGATCLSVDKIYPVLGEYITVEDKPNTELECVIAVHSDEYFLDITDYEQKKCKPWKSETLCWEVFVFRKEKCGHRPAYSPHPYVDLLNPAATREFVKFTHAEYKKRFKKQWGKVIKGFFTDEPGFYQNYLEQCKNLNTVIWTDDFATRFIEKFGYDIRPHLCCLWQNMGAVSVKTRCDYYKAVAEFYKEGYFDVISDFLHKDGLIHIGHLHREDFIESLVQTESDFFSAMNALDASGIDFIDRNPKKITERLGSSAAHVYDKEICFSETFGGFGWSLTPEEMKIRTDVQYVQGINMLVPHAFFYSTDGIRKTESPPSLFFQNGYWKYFKQYADYVKRLSYIGRCGEFCPDAAVYFPVETSWAEYRPLYRFSLHELDEQLLLLTEGLNENGVCFDFLNDYGIETKLSGKCGIDDEKCGYKSIILPFTSVMSEKTLVKLTEFAGNGGYVVSVGDFSPVDENGLKSELYEKTLQTLIACDNFVVFKKHGEEEAAISVVEKLGLSLGKNVKGVFLLKRKDGNREIDFLVNATCEEKAFTVKRKGFSGAEIWNAENGEITPANYTKRGGETTVYVRLRPYGSVIVAFSDDCGKPRAEADEKIIADVTENWIVKESGKEVERANFFAAGKQNFSGEVTFTKKISIEKPGGKVMLGLENVQSYASVKVNGGFAGAKLWSPYEFDVTANLKNGENTIEITVGSTEENAMTGSNKNYGIFGRIMLSEVKNG